jgi:ABC-type glycerol-3-phosphate transport system substrate-binding protein
MMKKFLALILALVMSLSLVACGRRDTTTEETTDDTATEETTAAP